MSKERLQRSLRATFFGILVNLVLAGGKMTAGVLGKSHALIADGVESLADIFSSLIVWRGIVVASTPADDDHPYGHGKAEPIASAIVATMLLFAAAGIAVKSFQEIMSPQETPAAYTLIVLIGVVAIKESLYRFVKSEGEATQNIAVKTDAWHHRSDAITSIAAFIGISIALIGGKGYEPADDIAALVASGFIAFNGWRLLKPAMNELMDTSPDPVVVAEIRSLAEKVDGVDCIEKCFVRKMGYNLFVDMHVHVDSNMTVEHAHQIAHNVKDIIKEKIPVVSDVLIHIEPSLHKNKNKLSD
ncbi:MAG: cation diffusion facilitator family transporter [Verrucomicrobiae bacterium]|nr:cation diffusion facilitator family transporter [Verrucomicrobiae bacterium]